MVLLLRSALRIKLTKNDVLNELFLRHSKNWNNKNPRSPSVVIILSPFGFSRLGDVVCCHTPTK